MAKLALKPDSSFFEKIVRGAIGSRAICSDLAEHGHTMVELERGSLDTKIWKDVKRKRVRIPDLLCTRCGLRVESRAKKKAELTMSHSEAAERAWDFGMTDLDVVAFPICETKQKKFWGKGKLGDDASYWHERDWTQWKLEGKINYFLVSSFRAAPYTKVMTKGVTEGAETAVSWSATFSTRDGTVETVDGNKVAIRRTSDRHRHTWKVREDQRIFVRPGESVQLYQVIASTVEPISEAKLGCPGSLRSGHIAALLASRERTQRFTGVKLARLNRDPDHERIIEEITFDSEEDIYIRLEGMAYLASVCGKSARRLFAEPLAARDEQSQLEAVIALGETGTPEAIELLSGILDERSRPYFLRSAAAWCMGQAGGPAATAKLIALFSDVDINLREEALDRIVSMGREAVPILLDRIGNPNPDIAAGCAEALRQQRNPINEILDRLHPDIKRLGEASTWPVWLLGHLPREQVGPAIATLQDSAPQLHYALSVLWSFVESWIARRWELEPGATFRGFEEAHDV